MYNKSTSSAKYFVKLYIKQKNYCIFLNQTKKEVKKVECTFGKKKRSFGKSDREFFWNTKKVQKKKSTF